MGGVLDQVRSGGRVFQTSDGEKRAGPERVATDRVGGDEEA